MDARENSLKSILASGFYQGKSLQAIRKSVFCIMRKIVLFCLLLSSAAYAQGTHGGITIVSTGLKIDSAVMTSRKKVIAA